ncbi:MAG: acyl-ACP thioesterase domain-containing protein [Rikenellaceae bacterium]
MATPTIYPITIDRYGTDMTQRASISTMINYILRVAGWDADAKGFGVGELNEENHTWVLSRFAVELSRLPQAGEKIEIMTWISNYSRLVTTRCFSISTPSGEELGGAVSQWCMLDLKARKAIDLNQLHKDYSDYILPEYAEPIARPRRIVTSASSLSYTHRAAYSDIDFNGHVNSLRYIDLMLNAMPIELLKQNRPLRVDLQYIHECYHGDNLTINHTHDSDTSSVEIVRNDTESAVKCMVEWR